MEEAWLSGPIENVSRMLMPAAHALMQASRDIEQAVSNLTIEEVWTGVNNSPSVGFHLLHIAGSIDRLLTYAKGETLSEEQFAELSFESEIDNSSSVKMLVEKAISRIDQAILVMSRTPEESLFEKREVGRKRLETNVFGLLFHIAEHTQRHTGQVITTAKVVKRAIKADVC